MIKYLVVFMMVVSNVFSQTNPVKNNFEQIKIPNTEKRSIFSHAIDQQYELFINLPNDYYNSKENYPVLYLLDAQWDFTLLQALYGQQYFDGFIPAMIIVGITWGGENADPNILRQRDFTPLKLERMPQSGGAEIFLSFLEQELIPFIQKEYRTTDERVLTGSSLGGLFTLYSMFSKPSLFKYYIATSPAFLWSDDYLDEISKKFSSKNRENNIRLFMAYGGLESTVGEFKKFVRYLEDKQFKGLKFKTKILEGIGHSGVKAEGNTRGLQFVYQKPLIHPGKDVLDNYTGTYKLIDKNEIIKVELGDNQLTIYEDNLVQTMLAASKTEFYQKGVFFEVEFKLMHGKVSRCVIKRFGSTNIYEKL